MPEIPDGYGIVFQTQLLNVYFNSGGPSDYAAAAYSRNFVRLCDLAIQEYRFARVTLMEYINTPNNVMSPLFIATGHFEQCIHAMRRAIRFARHKNGPRLPRTPVVSSDVASRIRNMRDAIEHTDERVRDKEIQHGDFLIMAVRSDGIELQGEDILYTELHEWLCQLQQLSEFVASHPKID